uniref:Protein kinase domain-containing protein n=1 Tax=Astyanax mexicanus TaxID=7994 RepID=A0A3B1JLW3_ASTMX
EVSQARALDWSVPFDYDVIESALAVKLAKSKRHRKKVAIKVVNLRKEDCEWAEKYLLQELAILGKVRHPHIANVTFYPLIISRILTGITCFSFVY